MAKQSVGSLFLFGAVVAAFFICGLPQGATAQSPPSPIPDYHVLSLDGKDVSIHDYKGKVVVLNTWATWCEPCRHEIPFLERIYQNLSGQGVEVVGVSIDTTVSDQKVKIFMRNYNMTYTVLRDPDNRFSHVFSTAGVPETILVDRNGNMVYRWRGAVDTQNDFLPRVELALGQKVAVPQDTSGGNSIGLGVAFVAGLLSFLSPCVLPLIPAYTTFITGMSLNELKGEGRQQEIVRGSVGQSRGALDQASVRTRTTIITRGGLFVLGFSLIFVLLGSSVALVGSLFNESAVWIARIGGMLIIVFGLSLLRLIRVPGLERQFRIESSTKPKHAGSFLVGLTFGAGWTPCIGPILAGILTLAASSNSLATGASLLTAYSAGLAVPFMLSAVAIDRFLAFFKRVRRWIPWIERASGFLLIAIGILLISGSFTILSSIFGGTLIPGDIFKFG